jgi:hypothetical protein
MAYEIHFEDDFDEYAWEVEAKGWFDVDVTVDEVTVPFSFYDPVRLQQEIESDLSRDGVFFEKNMVVVRSVTRANIEKAMKRLERSGILSAP